MRTLFLYLLAAILSYGCEEENKSSAEKEIRRLKAELEEKRKEISDKKELARLEEELNRLDDELAKVGRSSTNKDNKPTAQSLNPKASSNVARVKGSSVNLRAEPSVQSERISSLSNGEPVSILEIRQSNKTNEAILTKEVPLYASAAQTGQTLFTLPKGKAVVIEGYEEGTTKLNVSYQHPRKGKLYAQIDEAFIESIENGAWYRVERSNGQIGWVYEQFIQNSKN